MLLNEKCKSFGIIAQELHKRFLPISYAYRTLATLRDTLLLKLISGEIQVKDAEIFIESTT